MSYSLLQFETGVATHVGRVRQHNEDSVHVDDLSGVWMVADGMGGHRNGQLASTTVVDSAKTLGKPASAPDLLSRFTDRIHRANTELTAMSNGHDDGIMGSTVAAVLVFGQHFACVWAGDSRVYLIRAQAIAQMSRDHTEVQELLDKGIIKPEEAKTWPRRNVITRAIGVGDDPGLEVVQGELQSGDTFVICSDGLTGHVEDDEIRDAAGFAPVQQACDGLISLALERGGKDNVSVIVVRAVADSQTTVLQRVSGA
jgi:serine/threonine protein phosphatase PrpC